MPTILQVHSNPDSGSERFLNLQVALSNTRVDFDVTKLDRIGKRKIHESFPKGDFECFKAVVSTSWKSHEYRENCIDYLKTKKGRDGKNRWENVQENLGKMKAGEFPKGNPVFILPPRSDILTSLDGTRRLIAFLEFGKSSPDVIVIKQRQESK